VLSFHPDAPVAEWRDAATGALLRMLRLPGCYRLLTAVTWGGSVFGLGLRQQRPECRLARWDVPADARPGLVRRLAMSAGLSRAGPTDVGPTSRHPFQLAVSPDGRLLAATCWPAGVALYDAEALAEVAFLCPHGRADAVAFSPDGEALVVSGQRLELWPVRRLLPAS
jgi:hypothetical protein